jgi:hypothetical protein
MAPATGAGATPGARNARSARWTRDDIIDAITEWVALYGEPPRAADWNPSAARWSAAEWRIERYRKGRPDGTPWPSLNRAKAPFGGSLNAALTAAGFEPNRPGPKGAPTPVTARAEPRAARPADLADAIRELARARTTNNRNEMRRALTEVASAALSWKGRL